MQIDFHYYATYCAAYLAGYTHEECMEICYSAQFVDLCTISFLSKVQGPMAAATTQLQLELMDTRTDLLGLQNITRIWSSFHFLPYDLCADPGRGGKKYRNKFRLICNTNGELVSETVKLAKNKSLQAVGIAMHVLADTWAHKYFAGTPSLVINNASDFCELIAVDPDNADGTVSYDEIPIRFRHNPTAPDDPDSHLYTNSLLQREEASIMNLGHGRAGHLPDYSYIRYRYMPAWDDYRLTEKDNPTDYYRAFTQMVYAMRYLRGDPETFSVDRYDRETVEPYADRIREILTKVRLSASEDWKALGEEISGEEIPDFDLERYQDEYISASDDDKDDTFIGRFVQGAIAHKTMVSHEIYKSGNMLAGFVHEA